MASGSTTRAVLRQRLSQAIGDYETLTASSNGAADGTTIVDTELANLTEDDNGIAGWAIMSGGTAIGEERRITSYTASSTTITVNHAFSAQIDSADAYELHRIRPTDKHLAINRAIESLFPGRDGRRGLYLPLRDETLIVDSQLVNGGFESTVAGGAHPSWTNVGSPTVTGESTIVRHGAQSAKVVASGADGQMTQAPFAQDHRTINMKEITGETATFKAWVYATAASSARIRLDWDGASFENSDYHTGADQWELLEAEASVPSTATQVKAICEVADGNTGYFDMAWVAVGPIWKYTIPAAMRRGPHYVYMQYNEDQPEGPYYQLPQNGTPLEGRALRLEGMGLLSRPASETGTTEVDGEGVDLIVARAALFLQQMLEARGQDLPFGGVDWQEQVDELLARAGSPVMSAEYPTSWRVEEDSSGRYLHFHSPRTFGLL